MRHFKDRLQNPFALIAQGFVLGIILFWTVAPHHAKGADVPLAAETALSN